MEKTSKMPYNDFKDLLKLRASKIKRIPQFLGENAFIFILIFILIEVILGELIFYKYIFSAKIHEPQTTDSLIEFRENIYQSVLREQQKRKEMFENSLREAYPDPFFPVSQTNTNNKD